jgi:hypothetical protein
MHKSSKSKSRSRRWGEYSDWVWEAERQFWYRVRQDADGSWPLLHALLTFYLIEIDQVSWITIISETIVTRPPAPMMSLAIPSQA